MTDSRAAIRVLAALLALGAGTCARVTGLPPVPASVTREQAGLDRLSALGEESRGLARPVTESERAAFASRPPTAIVDRLRSATDRIASGDEAGGLELLRAAVAEQPGDLLVGNAFRMQVYRAQRAYGASARAAGRRAAVLPAHLAGEPLSTLQRALEKTPTRELELQIALAYVDRMFQDPALEVRAPASIDSVHTLSGILEGDAYYVPALVGRGLNHLNRPRRLVWPEHPAPPENAASRDLAQAAAVGAAVGGASDRVKGFLLLLLGDAYAHEGKAGLARSWWTLAGETTHDDAVQKELAVRASWPETEMPDRLEARLEDRMNDVDAPVSDLSFLWDDGARGPW